MTVVLATLSVTLRCEAAVSAFTRVFDALWRPSLEGRTAASFEARLAPRTSG
jgi:hypothetical protein